MQSESKDSPSFCRIIGFAEESKSPFFCIGEEIGRVRSFCRSRSAVESSGVVLSESLVLLKSFIQFRILRIVHSVGVVCLAGVDLPESLRMPICRARCRSNFAEERKAPGSLLEAPRVQTYIYIYLMLFVVGFIFVFLDDCERFFVIFCHFNPSFIQSRLS